MTGFCRRMVITSAAVALYCLAVSFGPGVLFRGSALDLESNAAGPRVAELH